MTRPRLVDVTARLDRLAELARAGVDVAGVLERIEREANVGRLAKITRKASERGVNVSLRLDGSVLTEADALADALADAPEAAAAGGHWGRSAVLRLAVLEGLRALRARAETEP